MSKFDFTKTVFRASCINQLMTPPKSKEDKAAGKLGATAKTFLRKMYGWEKYGRYKDLYTKYTEKGKMQEEEGITLVCLIDKIALSKNDVRLTSEYFTGEPDVFEGKSIKKATRVRDIKCSWDLDTFLSIVTTTLNKDYWGQGQVYCELTGAKECEFDYTLVNTPDVIIQDEKKKLFYKMNVATEQNPEYLAACAEIDRIMKFDDIPASERRVKFIVERDKEYIERAKEKVIKGREWLMEFQEMHLSGLYLNQQTNEEEE